MRKLIVLLKRQPYMIALLAIIVSFAYYSFNLTSVSNTTARIQGKGMGLAGFSIMLFSLLCLVAFFNVFKPRKPSNKPALVVLFVMQAIIVFCDVFYRGKILFAVNAAQAQGSALITDSTKFIERAYNMLGVHLILGIISIALVALVPVYGALIRKINTSVEVEDYGKLGKIEISGDE